MNKQRNKKSLQIEEEFPDRSINSANTTMVLNSLRSSRGPFNSDKLDSERGIINYEEPEENNDGSFISQVNYYQDVTVHEIPQDDEKQYIQFYEDYSKGGKQGSLMKSNKHLFDIIEEELETSQQTQEAELPEALDSFTFEQKIEQHQEAY